MRLAAFTDYGLRILMRLASTPNERLSTTDLATQLDVSQHHLTKVVQDLARGGFIITQRGAGGGISLAQDARKIGLGRVVRHLERRFALVECCQADGGNCVLTPRCRLKPRLLAAQEAFLKDLDRSTVADCAWPGDAAAA
ncbi:RrF2 family transcriptional regulator [Roseovarius sp. S4756]|uniref:RrF2 family transcriptional regulator n=1 Tax=Roseovarius maritimus TaxID=3342637 RepID=UPI00372A74E3